MDRKLGGAVPLWVRGTGSPSNTMWPGRRHGKFHLDPSNRLATVHTTLQTDRQDRQDRYTTVW